MRKLFTLLICTLCLSLSAQTYRQQCMVRLITRSADAPAVPMEGIRVQVGNELSSPSDPQGLCQISVPSRFQVVGVQPNDYLLALPVKGQEYVASRNDLSIAVIPRKQQQEEFRLRYLQIKHAYDAQGDSLRLLRQQKEALLDSIGLQDARAQILQKEIDSLRSLYLEHINNESKIDQDIRRMAEELSLTDYQLLDSIDRVLYDLKCQGHWATINELLSTEVYHGDAQRYVNQGVENKQRAEELLRQAVEEDRKASEEVDERLKILNKK